MSSAEKMIGNILQKTTESEKVEQEQQWSPKQSPVEHQNEQDKNGTRFELNFYIGANI